MRETLRSSLSAWIIRLIECSFVNLLWLTLVRLVFAWFYVPKADMMAFKADLPKAFLNGFRFDMQVIAYVSLLPLLFIFLSLPFPKEKRERGLRRFFKFYFPFLTFFLLVLACIDMKFYENFNSHINVVFFDFFNEGPWGLTLFIWQTYPVLRFLLGIIFVVYLTYRWVKHILYQPIEFAYKIKGWMFAGMLIFYLVITAFFLRGSFGLYPLQVEDTIVSANEKINLLSTNFVYELKCSYKKKNTNFTCLPPPPQLLRTFSFSNLDEAVRTYANTNILTKDTFNLLKTLFFKTTPTNDSLEKRPTLNVVVLVCESWGLHLMDFGCPDFDLLGSMRKHFEEDLFFTNFQSVQNGTGATLQTLIIGSPYNNLFQSKYAYAPLPTSIAFPFAASGYDTYFYTGMDQAWGNLSNVLPHQGFQKIVGKYELLHKHPEYQYNHPGIYDPSSSKLRVGMFDRKAS